ncbi:MAG: MATE family efflux transporter [Clostridiales bacterium]|nr:MATE family efflux transporter [Clostridiales bacterium]
MQKTVSIDRELFETMPVPQAVRRFVGPSLISTLITIIYSFADTFFVGLMGDAVMVAGLTVAFPYYQLLNALASLFGVGTNAVMSRSLGEKSYDRVSKASNYGFWGGALFMVFACIVVWVLRRPLLNLAGASTESYGYALDYLKWVFLCGGIPTVLSVVMANLLRAEGHAKKGSLGLMIGSGLNIILDPLVIHLTGKAVAGAAIATLISNCVSLIFFLCIYARMRGTTYINLKPFAFRVEWRVFGNVILSGLPSGFLTILGLSGCIMQTHLYSIYSDAAVAAWGVVNRMSFVGIYMTHGVAQGVLPLIGYNFGAKNKKRVQEVNKFAFRILLVIAIVLLLFCEIFSDGIIRAFVNDAATIEVGRGIMRCYMLCTPFMSVVLLTSTLCQAVGKWQYSLIMLTVRQLAINFPVTFLLNHLIGVYGVALGQPINDVISTFIAIFVYRLCFVKAMRGMDELPEKEASAEPAETPAK